MKRAALTSAFALPTALVIALLVACQAPVAESPATEEIPTVPKTVTLTGTVTSTGSQELSMAEAHLRDTTSMTHSESVQVEADGSFTLEVPTDHFFELWATAADHETAEIPLILEGEDQVEIHVALKPTDVPGELEGPEVSTTSTSIQEAMELVREVDASTDEFMRLYMAARESGKSLEELEQDRVELMADALDMALSLTDNKLAPAALRSYAAARFLGLLDGHPSYSDDIRERVLMQLPVDSIHWALAPHFARSLDPEQDADLILALRTKNPNPLVRGNALVRLIENAKETGNKEDWNRLYDELQEEYGDFRRLTRPLEDLNPNKRLKIGLPVPEFEVTLLDGREVSNESFKGSYLFLDFWATWCIPCIAEIPEIERAWAAHKDKNFQILSLSFDPSIEKIQPFRKEKYAMPWLHTFVEGGFTSELAESFGVYSIPEPVLIDPDGMIVATDETLRGEDLYKTITAHLQK